MQANGKQIILFLVLVFAFSSIPYTLIIHTGHLGGMTVALIMWCPALAAFAACAIFRLDLATLGWNWRPARYEVLGYVLPLFYALPVYLACWFGIKDSFAFTTFAQEMANSYGLGQWPRLVTLGIGIPLLGTIGMTAGLSRALGEEIGWRGFLLPRLVQQFGFTVGCLASGIIWAMWHYPVLLWADYNAGTNKGYALACFTIMVMGIAFIMGWLRLKSGSVWPCAMLHASHNLFVQAIFDRLTAPVGRALYVTTEFGAGLALTTAVVAFAVWKSHRGDWNARRSSAVEATK